MRNNNVSRDFAAFSTPTEDKKKHRKISKDTTIEIDTPVIIAVASVLVAIILIALVITIVALSNKNIEYKDNTFICYEDADGSYRLARNGKVLKEFFTDEIELTVASDNSFTYVTSPADEGYNVYLLNGSKLELICEGVEDVLAYAEFEPGVVYITHGRTAYWYDGAEVLLTGNDTRAKNVIISPDGSAIAYNCPRPNSDLYALYLYIAAEGTPEQIGAGKDSLTPVAVSDKGEYVVAYALNPTDNITKELYAITEGDRYRISGISGSFENVTYVNADSSEIVFTTSTGTDSNAHSYVYNCKNTGARKNNSAYDIGAGVSIPQISDSDIARLDTVKKCYFRNTTKRSTFYVNKKYETNNISSFLGQFNTDESYFYFINDNKKVLCKMEIKNGKGKVAESVAYDVTDFYITEKGNIYYLDAYLELNFYKLSQEKPVRIATDVTKMNFYEYANTLYFENYDALDVPSALKTTEGSDGKAFKLGKIEMTSLPTITNPNSKKTFAYFEDEKTGEYLIFYTYNGSSFKQIATANDIEE